MLHQASASLAWLSDPLVDMRVITKIQSLNKAGLERLIELEYTKDLVIPFGCLAEVR